MAKNDWKISTGSFKNVKDGKDVCSGTVKVKDGEISIELVGVLHKDDLEEQSYGDTEIIGDTNNGRVILKYGRESSVSHGRILTSKKNFSLILISDENINSVESARFDSVSFRINGLAFFVGKSNIAVSITHDEKSKITNIGVNALLGSGPFAKFETEEYIIEFSPTYKQHISLFNASDRTSSPVEEITEVILKKRKGKLNVMEIHEKVLQLKNFIAFALRVPVNPSEVIARNSEYDEKNVEQVNQTRIYWRKMKEIEYVPPTHPLYVLFTLGKFSDNFGQVMQNWFKLISQHKNLYNTLLSNLYASNQFIENKILSYFSAIESYITKTASPKVVKERNEQYKTAIHEAKDMLSGLTDGKVKEYLANSLNFFQEDINASEKLSILYEMLPKKTKDLIPPANLELAKQIRNKIVHGDNYLKLLEEGERAGVVSKLRALSEFCALLELQVQEGVIDDVLSSFLMHQPHWSR